MRVERVSAHLSASTKATIYEKTVSYFNLAKQNALAIYDPSAGIVC